MWVFYTTRIMRDTLKIDQVVDSQLTGCGLLTLEKYAEMTGLPLQVCLGHVNKGFLPCVTIGRRRLINTIALQRELAKKPFVFRG